MKLGPVVIAEGAVADARGAVTLVGVNQRAIVAQKFPFLVKVVVYVSVSDEDEDNSDEEPKLTIEVVTPKGEVQFSITHNIPRVAKPLPSLPQVANVAVDTLVSAEEPGKYSIEVRLTPGDSVSQLIYIVAQPQPN